MFKRSIDQKFLEKLNQESQRKGWWKDVLSDKQLLIALRGSYANVYWRGQSIFKVSRKGDALEVSTHEKYLLDPKLGDQVLLQGGRFEVKKLLDRGFITQYRGAATLKQLKQNASLYSGLEKRGCHEIAVKHPNVIDVEIAWPGKVKLDEESEERTAPRIDMASVEADGDSSAHLVFWEAKHYSNGELRAADEKTPAPVHTQIAIYEEFLGKDGNWSSICEDYEKVANNIIEIEQMRSSPRKLPIIEDIAAGRRRLNVECSPKVGLLIFGYDSGQRDEPRWKRHRKKLEKGLEAGGNGGRLLAAGNAKNIKLPT